MQKLRLPDTQHQTYHAVSWRSGLMAGVSIALIYYSAAQCKLIAKKLRLKVCEA